MIGKEHLSLAHLSKFLDNWNEALLSEIGTMSETTLKVGKKGEIFTNADLRKRANIKEGGKVKARVVENRLIIESIPSIEELLKHPVAKMTTKEAEKLSEQTQKEEGVYG